MSTVKYTNDCTTISSAVLSEVLKYAQVRNSFHPLLTVATPIESFQPPGSSLPQKERPKLPTKFLSTQKSLGLPSSIVHQYNLNLVIRKIHGESSSR